MTEMTNVAGRWGGITPPSKEALPLTMFPIIEVPVPMPNKPLEGANSSRWDSGIDTGYKMIIREDTNKVLSCMTNKYKVVTNREILETAVPILNDHDAQLKEAITFGDGQRSTWKWVIPDVRIEVSEGDYMNPEIIIKNSYDGTLQVHILAGAFRLVCSNGMVIGVTLGNKNYKHNKSNVNLDKLHEAIEKTINFTLNVGEQFPILKETKLKKDDIVKLIKLFPTTVSEFLVQYLISKPPETYWDLLNAGTYITSHKMKREYQSTHKLESQIFPAISKWAKA